MKIMLKFLPLLAIATSTMFVFAQTSEAGPYRYYRNQEPRCRYFPVQGAYGRQEKLFCRDRYSGGWQQADEQNSYQGGYPRRQPYGGVNYYHTHQRQQQETPQQEVQQQAPENDAVYETSQVQSKLAGAIDDLVAADSTSWVIHRFRRGSVHGEQIESTDPSGRPTSVRAHFNYQSGSSGWVRVRLAGGNLSCIEFWDFAGDCRALGASPSHALAAAAVVVGTVAVAAAMTDGGRGGSTSVDAEMKREKDQRDFQDMIQANRQIQENMQNH